MSDYQGLEEQIGEQIRQVTDVNRKFSIWTDERPDKHDYRHANMLAEFRSGAINYHKHIG